MSLPIQVISELLPCFEIELPVLKFARLAKMFLPGSGMICVDHVKRPAPGIYVLLDSELQDVRTSPVVLG